MLGILGLELSVLNLMFVGGTELVGFVVDLDDGFWVCDFG